MILTSFSYEEPNWKLEGLNPLKAANLLVSRNAVGKSRTLSALLTTVLFIKDPVTNSPFGSFESNIVIDNREWKMEYGFKVDNGFVEKEKLIVNGIVKINRTTTTAQYETTEIDPPSDRLIVQVIRNKELYPEIERLMRWAETVEYIPYSYIGINGRMPAFTSLVKALSAKEMKKVLNAVRQLQFDISAMKPVIIDDGVQSVWIKEKSVHGDLFDRDLSKGMFRTLYMLCYMFANSQYKPSLLLVDDLCEGLDYRRSAGLGKLVFDECRKNNIQLIASSNNAFTMDTVEIGNWQVLRREGRKVSAINESNNEELFRRFRETGSNNLELLGFLDNNTKHRAPGVISK